jgi:hypothetical protein
MQFNIYKSSIKIKTGSFRFVCNFLLGLAGFFPLLAVASCLLINPFIIPLISLSIVLANLFKSFITIRTIKYELTIDRCVASTEQSENSYNVLKNKKENLYIAQRDFIINSILTFGAAVSILGAIFPPIFIVGMGIGIIGGILGVLDKKFYFCKKIVKIFDKDDNSNSHLKNESDNFIKRTSNKKLERKPEHCSYDTIFKRIKPLTCKQIYKNSSDVVPIKRVINHNSVNTMYDNNKNTGYTYRELRRK